MRPILRTVQGETDSPFSRCRHSNGKRTMLSVALFTPPVRASSSFFRSWQVAAQHGALMRRVEAARSGKTILYVARRATHKTHHFCLFRCCYRAPPLPPWDDGAVRLL